MFLKVCVKISNSDIDAGLHKTFPCIRSVKYNRRKVKRQNHLSITNYIVFVCNSI